MRTEYSRSSASSSSSRSSSPGPSVPPTPSPGRPPSPDSEPTLSAASNSTTLESPPPGTPAYKPHSVGIGILSPQPILGPFSPHVTRASLLPLQARRSPVQTRPSVPDMSAARHTGSQLESMTQRLGTSTEDTRPSVPVPSPSLRLVTSAPTSSADTLDRSAESPSATSSAEQHSASGLRIHLPPPNPSSSSSTPSPPLLPPASTDIAPSTQLGGLALGRTSADTQPSTELAQVSADFNLDLTEFDADGLSALEKIYIFAKSRAGFHRVFITHALPHYLGSVATSTPAFGEEPDRISPDEAVEYILPILNGLAMDEVKEALAAELVPIVWWFITHCRLVEDDPSATTEPVTGVPEHDRPFCPGPTSSDGGTRDARPQQPEQTQLLPTEIPVQAFTPILGTLLLSPNGMVGGPARYAVVELLRRVRRADERDDHTDIPPSRGTLPSVDTRPSPVGRSIPSPSSDPHGDEDVEVDEATGIGLFGHHQRRMFEREIVQQVVIGMGRLDLPDEPMQEEPMEERQPYSMTPYPGTPMYHPGQPIVSPGDTTAVPTPTAAMQEPDSYFVMATSTRGSSSPKSPRPQPSASSIFASVATSMPAIASPSPLGPYNAALQAPSPNLSPSPPLLRSPSSVSTPSLVSSVSASSSSLESLRSPEIQTPIGISPVMPITGRIDETDAPALVSTALGYPSFPFPSSSLPRSASPAPGSPVSDLPSSQPARSTSETLAEQADALFHSASASEFGESVNEEEESGLGEEAAVGRLSSMSLMAAVTASGAIGEDTKAAFVTEVERVGRDHVYWVRREATFAVGALAKVVPEEVVLSSLLPLFRSLCEDTTWHVRHSVLFALPAILSRLSAPERRTLALSVILPLAMDESHKVRSAVLEALGEVMHTFADDVDGPPEELINLFLGIREDGSMRASPTEASQPFMNRPPRSAASESSYSDYTGTDAGPDADIYDDTARPLVCAFNYPAVALTLGRDRWPELRGLYLDLAQNTSYKVRRTLAASLGDLAKIVGEQHAKNDLMGVWWASICANEAEIRLKVIECLDVFVAAIGVNERREVLHGLENEISAGKLKTWREREEVVKKLKSLILIEGFERDVLRRLLLTGLDDSVAAVREAAVNAIPAFVRLWRGRPSLLEGLLDSIKTMARGDSFRKRTMFVTCSQALILSDQSDVVVQDASFWVVLSALAEDRIVDVRIRISRLLGLLYEKYAVADWSISERVHQLAQRLTGDSSHEVQAFARAIASGQQAYPYRSTESIRNTATFSRPPPPLS
ncbi:hypothetical protein CERSUDRAFT_93975 [Gelatoporia subvermispora B]|uniref:TOG domain-containing protein n=1 Tax=Ceriporiopsis subvermispora (strain B) TaxID=914234 RepID=M2R1R4_CERS8|nr:hypothetical protein CERSUDRAFT_93975 [Gelatoporia subvermispora B]